jgi:hypothetical protein
VAQEYVVVKIFRHAVSTSHLPIGCAIWLPTREGFVLGIIQCLKAKNTERGKVYDWLKMNSMDKTEKAVSNNPKDQLTDVLSQ